MHDHLLSSVILLLFIVLIWNIWAHILADIILLVLQVNFVILRVFRRMQHPRWYVWILYYNEKYLTLLATLWHLYWLYSCHRLPMKSLLYRAKLILIAIIPQITLKDNSVTLLLIIIMPQIIYKEFISSYFLRRHFFSQCLPKIMNRYKNMSTLGICLIYNWT